jgi:hypothetical protein
MQAAGLTQSGPRIICQAPHKPWMLGHFEKTCHDLRYVCSPEVLVELYSWHEQYTSCRSDSHAVSKQPVSLMISSFQTELGKSLSYGRHVHFDRLSGTEQCTRMFLERL